MMLYSGDFDEKYGIFLSRYHARVGDIFCTHRSWRSTPGQLLKKVAQAKPKGLLHLFVLSSSKLFNLLYHLIPDFLKPWNSRFRFAQLVLRDIFAKKPLIIKVETDDKHVWVSNNIIHKYGMPLQTQKLGMFAMRHYRRPPKHRFN